MLKSWTVNEKWAWGCVKWNGKCEYESNEVMWWMKMSLKNESNEFLGWDVR